MSIALKKSSLTAAPTWDRVAELLALNAKHDLTRCVETATKMLNNILGNPDEAKYRKIRPANEKFSAAVYSHKGAPELFSLCGFSDRVEEGFLVLPETVDLERVRKGVSVLAEAVTAREQADALKRKADEEAAARAKRERAEKANASKLDELLSKPGGVSAALEASAGAGCAGGDDEEEDLLAAIEAYFAAHPECAGGRTYDAFEIERQQEIGKGGILVQLAASQGTKYHDHCATVVKSDEGGAWKVKKVEEGTIDAVLSAREEKRAAAEKAMRDAMARK